MERIVGFIFLIWLAAMAVGIVSALLPVLAFVAGFVGVILLFALFSRWVSSWLW